MIKYKNAFTEVHTILKHLQKEDYEKIPQEIIETIEQNIDEEYYYEIKEELDLSNQEMLLETKAILFNLFRDYLSTPEQKEKIINMQKEERRKNEIKKKEKYDFSDIFENRINRSNDDETKENRYMVEVKKENILKKIINKIIKKIIRISNKYNTN